MSEPSGNVSIPKAEYEALLADQKELRALEQVGVDNWIGYEDAMELLLGDD
jgi:hypothetical protein